MKFKKIISAHAAFCVAFILIAVPLAYASEVTGNLSSGGTFSSSSGSEVTGTVGGGSTSGTGGSTVTGTVGGGTSSSGSGGGTTGTLVGSVSGGSSGGGANTTGGPGNGGGGGSGGGGGGGGGSSGSFLASSGGESGGSSSFSPSGFGGSLFGADEFGSGSSFGSGAQPAQRTIAQNTDVSGTQIQPDTDVTEPVNDSILTASALDTLGTDSWPCYLLLLLALIFAIIAWNEYRKRRQLERQRNR